MSFSITQTCIGCQACVKVCPVMSITGEKKEIHKIDPSTCIECGACGRICPYNSVLDQNGNPCVMMKRTKWMKPEVNANKCMSCNMCIEICPANCLYLSQPFDSKSPHGFPYLKDMKACIGCSFCASECPVEAISMKIPAGEMKA